MSFPLSVGSHSSVGGGARTQRRGWDVIAALLLSVPLRGGGRALPRGVSVGQDSVFTGAAGCRATA